MIEYVSRVGIEDKENLHGGAGELNYICRRIKKRAKLVIVVPQKRKP